MNLESLRYRGLTDYLSFYDYRMLPLSFKEFLTFYEFETVAAIEERFQRYLQFGGMPILREYRFHEARSNQALEGIYATVVLRYDVKGKQLLKTLGKHYIIDLGFPNMLLGYRDADRGHIMGNIVFLELLRRDYRVYIGKVGDAEVDFVVEKPNDKLYIRVTESMQTPETRERELRPLQMIWDNYEKIVLSMDRDYINSYEGIKALNLIDWLLS